MKIVLVNTLYPPIVVGGAEKSVSLLARALQMHGHTVVVVSLHSHAEELITWDGEIKVYRLPLDNIYWPFDTTRRIRPWDKLIWHSLDLWNFRAARRVAAILKAEIPDVVHTNNITGFSVSIWAAARRLGFPIVHTLRDYSLLCRRATLFRNGKNCEKRCIDCRTFSVLPKVMSQSIDEVASNSSFVLKTHEGFGYFFKRTGSTIFNIMDQPAKVIRASPPSTGTRTFGYIGKIDMDKGIEVVLAATKLLKNNNWQLLVAGRGRAEYENMLKARFPDPRIVWKGFIDSSEFYKNIDVCLISSIWHEPLPRTLIESIANDIPVICARAGGIPEIWGAANMLGAYQPTDHRQLAMIMDRAIEEDLADCTAEEGVVKQSIDFSPGNIIQKYVQLYEKAIGRKR